MLDRYREALAMRLPGTTLWLAPTWRAAAAVRDRLLGGGLEGCFSPGVMTFDQFAEAVLQSSPEPVRPLGSVMKRRLVRRLLDEQLAAGGVRHFEPIASSGGLVDLVCELIRELKRLDIWPDRFRKACEARGMTQKDRELLAVYEAYQQCLTEHKLYDAEGRFWSARTLLREGHWRPLERLRLVVVDGFADFTPPQHEIFEILAGRVGELLITLPLESDSRRPELFAKPRRTLAELRLRHPGLVEQPLSRPTGPSAWPAMGHLERTLFLSPRIPHPPGETAGLEILAGSRQLGEIELIGSRIKRLLCGADKHRGARPVRPGEIAVVLRSVDDAAGVVREVFGKLGIPFALEGGRTLASSTALAGLVGLIRLLVEDWPFRDLLAVLSNGYFQPEWPEWQDGRAAAAAERAVRELQVPRGCDRLFEQLRREAGREPSDDGGQTAREGRRRRARLALALLERLRAALARLPERATLAEWAAAWEALATETGLLRSMERPGAEVQSHTAAEDKAAWRELQRALGVDDMLAQRLGRNPAALDREGALAALLDTLRTVRVRDEVEESGRVRVLSAASARALEIPYLFFAGLAEQSFPRVEREDRLYSETEYRRLIEAGLPLVARSERSQEEMLLFYEVMTRATRRLCFSYPALDEAAQPLSASPYLEEVEEAYAGVEVPRTVAANLSPVPSHDEPLTAAEFRVKAVATALEGNVSLLAGLVRREPAVGVAEAVLAGLRLVGQRRDRKRFGAAEGVFRGPAARAHLATHFGPERTFAATELEQYASCPFRYFVDRVLRLEPLEDLGLEVDYLARGRLVHDTLAAFHQRLNRAHGGPTSPAAVDQAEYDRLLAETLAEMGHHGDASPIEAALAEVDRRLWTRWAVDYRRQHEQYDALWEDCDAPLRPAWFEVSFGRAGRGGALSTDRPLELETPAGPIRISGRIDRIDVGSVAGQRVFNILDYKTGRSVGLTSEAVLGGTALQLPLYAMASEDLLLADEGVVGLEAGYWEVREKGFRSQQSLKMATRHEGRLEAQPDWLSLRREVTETVGVLVEGIRGGQFPVCSTDERCTRFCPFSTICRVNQIRSLEKRWQPHPEEA